MFDWKDKYIISITLYRKNVINFKTVVGQSISKYRFYKSQLNPFLLSLNVILKISCHFLGPILDIWK